MDFDLDDAIGYIIETTEQALKRGLRRRFREAGYQITPYQWVVLYRLWGKDGLTQTELADITLRDKPTVTRIIDVLSREGLVRRESHPDDRRSFKVCLTRQGRELREALPEIASAYLREFTEGIPPSELELTKEVLRKIRNKAEQDQEQAGLR